jgi:hypothetical protein
MRKESDPSVSILLPTHSTHPDNQQDPILLKNLLNETQQRLVERMGSRPSWSIQERLQALADEIDWERNEAGLALFASEDFGAWYRLPFTVEARVAVENSFETREILYALHRMPRYRVLSLSEEASRLFEGTGTALEEMRLEGFPVSWKWSGGATRPPDGPMMQRSNVRQAHLKEFYTDIDQRLTAVTKSDALPLVLMGAKNTLSTFERTSANVGQVAVRIEGSYAEATPAAIAELAWPGLQEWLGEERQTAVSEVGKAHGQSLLASGIVDAWTAAQEGRGGKLVVEDGYRQAAILHQDGWSLEPVPDDPSSANPSHTSDAVDELIELVLEKSGEVVFVDEGVLADYGQVALILRY